MPYKRVVKVRNRVLVFSVEVGTLVYTFYTLSKLVGALLQSPDFEADGSLEDTLSLL